MISAKLENMVEKIFDIVTKRPMEEADLKAACEEFDIAALWYDIAAENENRLFDAFTGDIIVQGRVEDKKIYIYDSGEEIGETLAREYKYNGTGLVHTYVGFRKNVVHQEYNEELIKLMSDISYTIVSRQNMLSMLHHAESTDSHTGIPNSSAMMRKYIELTKAGVKHEDICMLFLNIQNFKYINEEAGSNVGDEVIIRYARHLVTVTKGGEYVCRLGGDNFVLLIKRENLDDALDKLGCVAIDGLNTAPDRVFDIHPWIGVSKLSPGESRDMTERVNEAAMACNLGRHKLKQSVVYFSENVREQMNKGRDIIMMFDSALADHEFVPFFQAKVDMRDGSLVGFESLCRWKRGDGFIYPDQFIPVLDKEGLIHQVDMTIFEETCLAIRRWKDMGLVPPRISSNFSRKNLFVNEIEEKIIETVKRCGIEVSDIEIEITESVKTNEYDRLKEFIQTLHNKGIMVSVDDFGTGYSSLSLIHSVDADVIKIDKSFVDNITTDEKSGVLINSIIGIAKNLNMKVIAEGVETSEQGELLLKSGCNYAQGYYYSRPSDYDTTTEIIRNPQFKPIAH